MVEQMTTCSELADIILEGLTDLDCDIPKLLLSAIGPYVDRVAEHRMRRVV